MPFKGNRMFGVYLFASILIAAVTLKVNQNSLNGTVGQSVLLSASYTVSNSNGYFRIKWLKAETRIVEYRCLSSTGNKLAECNYRWSVQNDYRLRTILFPKNASLLLEYLQLNDSGVYELSISHSEGTEMVKFVLTVQPISSCRIEKRRPGVEAEVRYLSLIVIFIFLCFTMKVAVSEIRSKQKKKMFSQDVQNLSVSNPAVLYSELKLSQEPLEER